MSRWLHFIKRGGAWVVAQGMLLLLVVASHKFTSSLPPQWPIALHEARRIIFWTILGFGSLLVGFGVLRLGKDLTPLPMPSEGVSLRTDGVYRWVRHPIYGGILQLSIGIALGSASMATLFVPVLVFVFFDRKASYEEEWLLERFPEYADYRRSTKKLIPWIF